MSQASLDSFAGKQLPAESSSKMETMTDEHIAYLYDRCEEGITEYRIQEHLLEEKAEEDEIKRTYEELYGHISSQYIRVGSV